MYKKWESKLKIFYKEPKTNKIYRSIISVTETKLGHYKLPPNCYSKGYIERIIDGIKWENYPYVSKSLKKKLNAK